MLDPWFRYRYPLKHLKKWLGWPWVIHLPLRGADAVCFTCDRERLLARQSLWLYHCHKVVLNYGTKSIPDPGGDFARPFPEAHPPPSRPPALSVPCRHHPFLCRWLVQDPTAAVATEARRCFFERYEITNASLSIARTIHDARLQRQLAQTKGHPLI
jgi:hypothetical protein